MIAACRTRLGISLRHRRGAPRTADGFPNMPLQNRAALAAVRKVAAVIAIRRHFSSGPVSISLIFSIRHAIECSSNASPIRFADVGAQKRSRFLKAMRNTRDYCQNFNRAHRLWDVHLIARR
jgi:hypothetical protein